MLLATEKSGVSIHATYANMNVTNTMITINATNTADVADATLQKAKIMYTVGL